MRTDMKKFLLIVLLLLITHVGSGAVDFESSTTDSVNCPNSSNQITGVFSAGAWVNVESDTGAEESIVGKDFDATSEPMVLRYDADVTNHLHCGTYDGTESDLEFTTTLTPGTWYHIACTCNASNEWTIYIDGSVVAGPTDLGTCIVSNVNTASITIGNNFNDTRSFDGVIEDVFFTGQTWTTAQIETIAKSRVKRMPLQFNPDHFWPLDEVSNGVSIASASFKDLGTIGHNCTGVAGDGFATTNLTYP